ncbi:MAG TPA: DUF6029 family protein [Myxococcota bacterium]|nr:DUF6029 family protein [Myxococcota bacterium]HRY92328.1 DUF6029 family protein [Myxococcota bacterium]
MRSCTQTLAAALLALLLLAPRAAPALELELPWLDLPAAVDVTGLHVFEHHADNLNGQDDDDGYQDLRNQLTLKLAIERFRLSVRLESVTFFGEPARAAGRVPFSDHYVGEEDAPGNNPTFFGKVSAGYDADAWRAELGDFYATFGRGLALRVHKSDPLGEDTTILGAKGWFTAGPVEVTALSGLTNASSPDLYEKTVADPWDLVSGLSASARIADLVDVGAHGVWYLFDPAGLNDQASMLPDHTVLAGLRVEVPSLLEVASLYLEGDWLGSLPHPIVEGQETEWSHGYALYAHGHVALGDVSLDLEAKSYRGLDVTTRTPGGDDGQYNSAQLSYIRPPTLEPEDMEVENNHDVSGGRLELSYRPNSWDTLLLASYTGLWSKDYGSAGHRYIYNLRGGVEQDFLGSGRARVLVGLREETPDYAGGLHQHLLYTTASVKIPLTERHSLELHGTHWKRHKRWADEPHDSIQGEWVLGYAWSPWLAASLIFGYDTEPSGETELEIFADRGGEPIRQAFLAGSLTLNLWSTAVIRVLGGQMRGGLKCIEGVCKVFPPFAGVRTDVTLRF